jgi:outer membrane protein TolC
MNRVESSYADVRAASDQVALIETSLLKDAADLLSAGLTNYQYGKIDSLNLFDIYRLHRSAQFEHFRALLNYHLSLAELEAAGEEL